MLARLVSSKGGRVVLACVAGIVCIVSANMHQTEWFSDDGYSQMGGVTVDCGGAFSSDIEVTFNDYDEQYWWDNYNEGQMWDFQDPADSEYIFDGKTARQVCSDTRSGAKTLGIGSGIVGGILLLSAFFPRRNNDLAAPALRPLAPMTPSVPPPAARPVVPTISNAPAPTPARVAPTVPAKWAADPYQRFELRYWDGTRWTEHVSTGGVQQVDHVGG